MKNLDLKALGKSIMLTGCILSGATLGMILVKYANPIVTTIFLIVAMIVFFYWIIKD